MIEENYILVPLLYVFCIALSSSMNIYSIYYLMKEDNYYFMFGVSAQSLAVLMCWDFQLFGFNMMLG